MKLLTLSDRLAGLGLTTAVYAAVVPALFLLSAGVGRMPARPAALKMFDIALPAPTPEEREPEKPSRDQKASQPNPLPDRRIADRAGAMAPAVPAEREPPSPTPEPSMTVAPAPLPPVAVTPPETERPAAADASTLRTYAARLWAHIAARRPPGLRLEGTTTVAFTVTPEGATENVSIARPSGNAMLDRLAVRTVRLAAPLPAPPTALDDGQLRFTIPFSFR